MTQSEAVLKYIQDFGSITSWESFTELGCTRLSARIFELRAKGYEFDTKTETSKNRYGNNVSYTKYKLKEKNNG